MTACNAAMLLLIAFVLTWRAKESQARVDYLVSVDVRAVSLLSDLVRSQNSFQAQWQKAALSDDGSLASVSPGYGMVARLLDNGGHPIADLGPLEHMVVRYGEIQRDFAERWAELTPVEHDAALALLDASSQRIIRDADGLAEFHRNEIASELPALQRGAGDMMWIALAIAYIIAIMTFAISRVTLSKVVRPLENLAGAAEAIAAGDLSARAPVRGDHEIVQLGDAFNRMADALSESYLELNERARTDELTKLPNFRAFREILDGEIERANRYDHFFGMLVLDLDHFKQYNDRFGHQAGNEALKAVAQVIRERTRTVDYPARYGGEEFAVILPEIDSPGMRVIAERIRAGIQDLPAAPGCAPITVSIGGALFPVDGTRPEPLFVAADQRLYEAKGRGRNCVVIPRNLGAIERPA